MQLVKVGTSVFTLNMDQIREFRIAGGVVVAVFMDSAEREFKGADATALQTWLNTNSTAAT